MSAHAGDAPAAAQGRARETPPPGRLALIARGAVLAAIPRRCKYEPTCSRYAVEAIREYGILRGAVLGAWRLLRCNPWSYGGYDPVDAQRMFHTAGSRDA
jgi:hypothetical protein